MSRLAGLPLLCHRPEWGPGQALAFLEACPTLLCLLAWPLAPTVLKSPVINKSVHAVPAGHTSQPRSSATQVCAWRRRLRGGGGKGHMGASGWAERSTRACGGREEGVQVCGAEPDMKKMAQSWAGTLEQQVQSLEAGRPSEAELHDCRAWGEDG